MPAKQTNSNVQPSDNDGLLRVQLAAVGNPDHGEDPDAPMYGVENSWQVVDSLGAASAACQTFIDENELGGGNWSGGDVVRNGEKIARISYNGRIWNPDGSAYEAPLLVKTARAKAKSDLGM